MNAEPPIIKRAGSRLVGIILVVATLGGLAILFSFNPASHAFYPVCQFHRLTGLNCPGCGMTRAAYALLHGNFAAASRDNLLFILGLIALGLRGIWFGVNRWRGRINSAFFPGKYLWLILVVTLLFTVLRNLSPFGFLSP
jgi:magnesium-transporting ATPase (P-type)